MVPYVLSADKLSLPFKSVFILEYDNEKTESSKLIRAIQILAGSTGTLNKLYPFQQITSVGVYCTSIRVCECSTSCTVGPFPSKRSGLD